MMIEFPAYSGVRCLMMPYVQGEPESVPDDYESYRGIVASTFIRKGDVGFLTIDESPVIAGKPHRGARARHARALHTEAGVMRAVAGWGSSAPGWGAPSSAPGWGSPVPGWGSPSQTTGWGSAPTWGGRYAVTLDRDVRILIASNVEASCAIWDAEHEDTSEDGDIGYAADAYPYDRAAFLMAGEVREIGIFTPHESLPVKRDVNRQFLRIVGAGVHGREEYFTVNPLAPLP